MGKLVKKVGCGVLVVACIVSIAVIIEWRRQRGLGEWAEEIGGTFEAGGIIEGVEVPEAEAFSPILDKEAYTYHNAVRVSRGDVQLVIAVRHSSSTRGTIGKSGRQSSSEDLVALVAMPGADFPSVGVWTSRSSALERIGTALDLPEPSAPLAVPDAVEGFDAAFHVRPRGGAGDPDPASLARLLPPAVQRELLAANEDLLLTLEAEGHAVLVRSGQKRELPYYRKMLALADRLAKLWRP